MATYKKPLKAFMATTLMGLSAQAMDTADGKRIGSYAIDAFEGKKTIETEDNDVKILVPFHAVQTAMYATMTEDAEKADAYCGGGTEPIGEVWFTGTMLECEASTTGAYVVATDKANATDLIANHSSYSVAVNGTEMVFVQTGDLEGVPYIAYSDTGELPIDNASITLIIYGVEVEGINGDVGTHCPTDITAVEVTVAHK